MTPQKPTDLHETIEMLERRLEQIQDEVPDFVDDYHELFDYFVGERFEGISPDQLKITDQKSDQQIDFYEDFEDRFVAYQCKLPDLDKVGKIGKVQTYGPNVIDEIENILTFLTDEKGNAVGNKFSQEARNRYRSLINFGGKENATSVEVVLAIFGNLTPAATEKLEELKSKWETEDEKYQIKVITYDDFANELRLSSTTNSRPEHIVLDYRKETEIHTNDWGYALVPGKIFVDLFDEYKMSLFDLNVRYFLERSVVNKNIIRTLNTIPGQKRFHLLNNGITISCRGWAFPKKQIRLSSPQIINGCQTVISLFRAYTQFDEEHKRRSFEDHCYVPVRIVNTTDSDLLDEVVMSSNNQNKMSPRNLQSNSKEQRLLQNLFDQLDPRWFYERKDGEFLSSKQYETKGFKIKNYQYGPSRYRQVSNEDVAKTWLSFIGFSKDASERIYAFETELEGGRYEWLFTRTPGKEHWKKITLGPQTELVPENFEAKPPSAEQFLLSFVIYQFAKAFLPTPIQNRKQCEDKMTQSGKITEKSSSEDVNKAMMEDDDYVINQIMYNMKEVLIELFAWILIKTYGPIDKRVASDLLSLPDFKLLIVEPDFPQFVANLKNSDSSEKTKSHLYICLEFIREGVKRWKTVHGKEYLTAQRRIRFLHADTTIEHFKQFLLETNEQTKEFGYSWKPRNQEFLKSLPDLT